MALQGSLVQIFGVKGSQATRAAERFFKERRIEFQMVDLERKAMAPAEIRRFTDKFGLAGIVDTESKAYVDAGLKYLRQTEAEMLGRMEREPKLLKLPLVRSGSLVSVGKDEAAWRGMCEAAGKGKA
jgi:arsenate reductase-like glutaredoxin family protein